RRGFNPDVLVMTATPIPRSLAMTVYGDLEVSVIDELPPGRTPVKTYVRGEDRRQRIYAFIRGQLSAGRQAYIVYPLVEESEKLDLRNATEMYEQLQREAFQGFRLGMLHGRMKPAQKEEVMADFSSRRVDLLVATTVVEVGIDVPNATVMLIEHAERFGLSQLHQLRGRVGRGGTESHCILMTTPENSRQAQKRLKIMEETTDGFVVAEKDLELRGAGEIMGTRQSGLPIFRVANLIRDQALLELARQEAEKIIENQANRESVAPLIEEVRRQPRFGLARIG
ncbi:MAG: DNA helicase RecG, partial [Acidobacteria bacterium]|nr:DNA helicase RecG [Acidobacteriota bacterium]